MLLNKNFFRQAIAKIQLSIGIDGAFVVELKTLGARVKGTSKSKTKTGGVQKDFFLTFTKHYEILVGKKQCLSLKFASAVEDSDGPWWEELR